MTKIIPSALVSAIQGKMNGSIFQNWKGHITLRRLSSVSRPKSAYYPQTKGTVSTFAGCFYMMSSNLRDAWRYYAGLLPTVMTGFNAFLSRNTALNYASHPGLCTYFTPPCVYDPPFIPAPVYLCYYPDSGLYCLFWTYPSCFGVYVQGLVAQQIMYSNEKFPSFHIFDIVPSTCLYVNFSASAYFGDVTFRFAARSINAHGEISASSSILPPPDLPPCLALVAPNGGESFTYGDSTDITWRCKSIQRLNILFSDDNGDSWESIATSILAITGVFTWTIPNLSSSECLIKLLCTDTPDVLDISDSTFEISNA